MIEVQISYSKRQYKSGREKFIYKDLLVKGHASNGTLNSIKCCAGVTAITCGVFHLLDNSLCKVEVNKGYFHLVAYKQYDEEINSIFHVLIYQLANISTIYPEFFNEFQFKEIKQDE